MHQLTHARLIQIRFFRHMINHFLWRHHLLEHSRWVEFGQKFTPQFLPVKINFLSFSSSYDWVLKTVTRGTHQLLVFYFRQGMYLQRPLSTVTAGDGDLCGRILTSDVLRPVLLTRLAPKRKWETSNLSYFKMLIIQVGVWSVTCLANLPHDLWKGLTSVSQQLLELLLLLYASTELHSTVTTATLPTAHTVYCTQPFMRHLVN